MDEEIKEEQNEDEEMIVMEQEEDLMDHTAVEEEKYLDEHPEERIFKDLLTDAKYYQSYKEPAQLGFELSNQVRLRIRPLIRLLLHEYQEYLHHPAEVDLETVFENVCQL